MLIATIAVVVFVIIVAVLFRKEQLPPITTEQLAFNAAQKFPTQYISGHSEIREPLYVYLVKAPGEIQIVERKLYQDSPPYNTIATIPYTAITGIETEDQSGIEKKFSLGRFMLIGVYAFAWLKKQPKKTGYLVIHWQTNNETQTTIFKNEEEGALNNVSLARNAILHWIKQSETRLP